MENARAHHFFNLKRTGNKKSFYVAFDLFKSISCLCLIATRFLFWFQLSSIIRASTNCAANFQPVPGSCYYKQSNAFLFTYYVSNLLCYTPHLTYLTVVTYYVQSCKWRHRNLPALLQQFFHIILHSLKVHSCCEIWFVS